MDLEAFVEQLFQRGQQKGLGDMEVYWARGRDFTVQIFEKEIADYSVSETYGLGFRSKVGGKMGYSYTERLDAGSIEQLITDVRENAQVIDSEDEVNIFAGESEYPQVKAYNEDFAQLSVEDKIAFARQMEESALAADDRVRKVNHALYSDGQEEIGLINTLGLARSFARNGGGSYVSVVVGEGERIKSAGKFVVGNRWEQFDAQDVANRAVQEAVSLLSAQPVKTGKYPVILRSDAAGDLLKTFSGIFSAEMVQKGFSLLAGKLHTDIASPQVTLIDDPLLPDGGASMPFDAEGVASRRKEIIMGGNLRTFLHNLKTAAKDGISSTGNAYRSSFKAPVGIAPTNLFIQPGSLSLEEMTKEMSDGLIIIELQGLHSGTNPISGDFSLAASGYLIEDGQIVHPVDQITVAGNFLEMLSRVAGVGCDLEFGLSAQAGNIGSPSLLIDYLSVAGE